VVTTRGTFGEDLMASASTEREGNWKAVFLGLLGAIALVGFYICQRPEAPPPTASVPLAAPARAPSAFPDLGALQTRPLPGGTVLTFPERGMEGRLVLFIEDPSAVVTKEKWFDFDRLLFDTNEATLRPESHEQLENIAVILRAFPAVEVKVGGYTDNSGPSDLNLRLSQARADSVRAELVRRGIAAGRIAAEGYGEKYPMGDNATPEGRAMNRRTAIRVTRK
jgi:outer membrane protein OmpA-like peptidoglycan-associated protein